MFFYFMMKLSRAQGFKFPLFSLMSSNNAAQLRNVDVDSSVVILPWVWSIAAPLQVSQSSPAAMVAMATKSAQTRAMEAESGA